MKRVLGIVLVAVAACQPRISVAPLPCPPSGIDPATITPAGQGLRTADLFIPPLPFPNEIRHERATIRLVVDSAGRVMPDSVTVCGITNPGYRQRLAEDAAGLHFVPDGSGRIRQATPVLLMYEF